MRHPSDATARTAFAFRINAASLLAALPAGLCGRVTDAVAVGVAVAVSVAVAVALSTGLCGRKTFSQSSRRLSGHAG